MKSLFSYIILITTISFMLSCDILDRPETKPAIIKVDKFNVSTNSFQGTNSSKITDVWVYIDNDFKGVFPLPATIPVYDPGNRNVKLYAGIKKNGIAATRDKYPFYNPFEVNMNLASDSVYYFTPTVTYNTTAYMWIEDFEDPNFKLNKFQNSDTTMFIASASAYPDLFEGDAGAIEMTTSYYCEMRTDEADFNDFPRLLETPVYLEMNYKCDHSFVVGLLSKDAGLPAYANTPLISLSPTTDENGIAQWNKTYLHMTDVINLYQTATDFDIYFSVTNNDSSNIHIYMDNLKVLFYK